MATSSPPEAFIWGAGGAKLSPAEVARQREIAAALMKGGMDYSPVEHWMQGAARAAQGLAGGLKERWAGEAAQSGREGFQSQLSGIFGGGSPAATASPVAETSSVNPVAEALMSPAPTTAATAAANVASTPPTQAVIGGNKQSFIDALMPAAIEASARTGVDPRIIVAQAAQETGWGKSAPNNNYFGIKSHGKSGGGTFSTTEYVNGKPVTIQDSFRGYESPADSVAGYADFLLENPRYKPMMGAQGLDAQLEQLGLSGYATDPNYANSVGSIARSLQVPEAAGDSGGGYFGTDTRLEKFGSDGERFTRNSANEPWQRASHFGDGGMGQGPRLNGATAQPSVAELLTLSGNEWATPAQSSVLNALIGQQLEQQDPMYQLQRQKAELELQQLLSPVAPKPIEVGGVLLDGATYQPIFDSRAPQQGPQPINVGGVLLDPETYQPIFDSRAPSDNGFTLSPGQQRFDAMGNPIAGIAAAVDGDMTDTQRNLSWRAEEAGLVPGTPEYAEFMRSGGQSSGMALTVGPDGTVQFSQGGAGGKALTEGQSKDAVYFTRASGSLPTIDALEQSLLSYGEYAAGALPVGLGNFMQSEDYQVAQNAGKEFLASILRKDTGAAVTPSEEALYGDIFLPRPGDKPATLERKKQARSLALSAIEAGMPANAIESAGRALVKSGVEAPNVPSTMPAQSTPPKLSSQAEFDAAPSGTVFQAPDGSIRVKP